MGTNKRSGEDVFRRFIRYFFIPFAIFGIALYVAFVVELIRIHTPYAEMLLAQLIIKTVLDLAIGIPMAWVAGLIFRRLNNRLVRKRQGIPHGNN